MQTKNPRKTRKTSYLGRVLGLGAVGLARRICFTHQHAPAERAPGYASIRLQENGYDENAPVSCALLEI